MKNYKKLAENLLKAEDEKDERKETLAAVTLAAKVPGKKRKK